MKIIIVGLFVVFILFIVSTYILYKHKKRTGQLDHLPPPPWAKSNNPEVAKNIQAQPAPNAPPASKATPEQSKKTQEENYWEKREKGYFVLGKYDLEIKFEYKHKGDKRHLLLKKVLMEPNPAGSTYLKGNDFDANGDERTFNLENIIPPITTNGKDYFVNQFYEEVLGNPQFPAAEWEKTTKPVWTGNLPINLVYSDDDGNEENYSNLSLLAVLQEKKKNPDDFFKCLTNEGKIKYFAVYSIETITGADQKEYDSCEFLEEILGIEDEE